MSTATVIIILFIIALGAIGLIFFSQARERARIERARRLAAAEDNFQHVYRLLDELPPQYLNQELCRIIVSRLEELALQLKSLHSKLDSDGKLADARGQLLQIGETPPSPVRITAPETARDIKGLLESLFRLIERQQKTRRIPADQARKLLRYVLFLAHRSQADLFINIGREETQRGNLRKAIHHYHLAATELGKMRDHPQAQKAIKACRAKIQDLEKQANASEQPTKAADLEKERLDGEWEEFIHDEEAWKKKADYDV